MLLGTLPHGKRHKCWLLRLFHFLVRGAIFLLFSRFRRRNLRCLFSRCTSLLWYRCSRRRRGRRRRDRLGRGSGRRLLLAGRVEKVQTGRKHVRAAKAQKR
uniref:(northern house mosquito) hypothetical protein n=1 Tax=Culex pipiens TaxID=7175 RepID=A0A8D8FL84_CULPI